MWKAGKLRFWELLGSGLSHNNSAHSARKYWKWKIQRKLQRQCNVVGAVGFRAQPQQQWSQCKKMKMENAAHLMQPRCKRSTEFMKLLFSKLRFISIIVFVAFQFCKFCKEDQKTPPWARNLRRHIRVSYIALISCKLPLKQGQSGFLARNGGLLYCANNVQITPQLGKRWVSLSL